jgi:flagellar protein FlaG
MDESIAVAGNTGSHLSVSDYNSTRQVGSIDTTAPSPKIDKTTATAAPAKDRSRAAKQTLDVSQAVKLANSIAETLDKKISFSYDDKLEQVIVKVVRESTGETIRQIPPQEMIDLMVSLREGIRGLVLNQKG